MKNPEPVVPVKKPRHVKAATHHLVIQRDKAITVRDKAAAEVKGNPRNRTEQ